MNAIRLSSVFRRPPSSCALRESNAPTPPLRPAGVAAVPLRCAAALVLIGFCLALPAAEGFPIPLLNAPQTGWSPAGAPAAAPRLQPTARHFHSCCYTTSLAATDFDGDGHLDLVAGNGLSYDVAVSLSDGKGGFAEPVSLPLAAQGRSLIVVATGDANGDGHADIVAAGLVVDQVFLLAGDGAGHFAAPVPYSIGTGKYPTAVALTDVNGDAHPDIVTSNGDSKNFSVLLSDGAGGFAAAVNFPGLSYPKSMAVADVNDDGHPDILTANPNTNDVSFLAGDGNGGFAAAVDFPADPGSQPQSITVADVDGDGQVDIVTANAAVGMSKLPGTISVLKGDGLGGFAAPVVRPAGAGEGRASWVAVGDITGDGHVDIVLTRPLANAVSVLVGDGLGGFAAAVNAPTATGPSSVILVDLGGSGHLDVVTGNAVGSSISVLPGDGAGKIGFDGNFDVGAYPQSVASGDLNGDGRADVVSANGIGNSVSVLLNDGAGGFAPAVTSPVGSSPTSVAIGDVNGDGHLDVVCANLGSGAVSVLLGDGSGAFGTAANFSVGDSQSPYGVALGDANEDGHLDIATANTNISHEGISLLLGDGSGQFGAAIPLLLGSTTGKHGPHAIVLADVTGDGHADIATANIDTNDVSLLTGDGSGAFAAAQSLPTDNGPVALAAGDVSGDGHLDLVTVNQSGQSVSVLAGDGAGSFMVAASFPTYEFESVRDYQPWSWGLALGDITGDGRLDIVSANTHNDTVSVLPNDGSGSFGTYFHFDTGANPGSVAVADINGDGAMDVVVGNRSNDNVAVLVNRAVVDTDVIFANGFEATP